MDETQFEKIIDLLRETSERLDKIYSILESSEEFRRRGRREAGIRIYTTRQLVQMLSDSQETQERTLSVMTEFRTNQVQVNNFLSKLVADVGTIGAGVNDTFRVTHKASDCPTGHDNAMNAFVSGNEVELTCLGSPKEKWSVRGWDIRKS